MTRLHMRSCRRLPEGPPNTATTLLVTVKGLLCLFQRNRIEGLALTRRQDALQYRVCVAECTPSCGRQLTGGSMVSDNFYPQPGTSYAWIA